MPEWIELFGEKHAQLMSELVREHFDLFAKYARMFQVEVLNELGTAMTRESRFQMNTIDDVRFDAERIVVSGQCYALR